MRREAGEVRLNLGCGLNAPAGWTNLDRSPSLVLDRVPGAKSILRSLGVLQAEHLTHWPPNVRRHDITKGLPYPDASVAAIYSSHTLEHIYFEEARAVLVECRRVLRPDGVLRLALPNAEEHARALLSTGDGWVYNEDVAAFPLARPPLSRQLIAMFGASPHRWQPTPAVVRDLLLSAGFAVVEERAFLEGLLPDLDEVEHRDGSLFVEALIR